MTTAAVSQAGGLFSGAWSVALARMVPLWLAMPIGPMIVRLIVGVAMGGFVAGLLPGALDAASPTGWAAELALGALLGLCASMPLRAARAAGLWTDAMAGRGSGAPLAAIQSALATAFFGVAEGPGWVVDAIGRTYVAVPAGKGHWHGHHGADAIVGLVAGLWGAALEVAMPVLAALLVAEVAIGIVVTFSHPRGDGARGPRLDVKPLVAGLLLAATSLGLARWTGQAVRGLPDDEEAMLRQLEAP